MEPVTYTLLPLTAMLWPTSFNVPPPRCAQAQVAVDGTYLATNRSKSPKLPALVSTVLPKATVPLKLPVTNTLPRESTAVASTELELSAAVLPPITATAAAQAGA